MTDPANIASDLRDRLKKHEGNYPQICALRDGLTYSWITKFAHGQAKNPTIASLQALKEALDEYDLQHPEAIGAEH